MFWIQASIPSAAMATREAATAPREGSGLREKVGRISEIAPAAGMMKSR
jgi:hypothetical protein